MTLDTDPFFNDTFASTTEVKPLNRQGSTAGFLSPSRKRGRLGEGGACCDHQEDQVRVDISICPHVT